MKTLGLLLFFIFAVSSKGQAVEDKMNALLSSEKNKFETYGWESWSNWEKSKAKISRKSGVFTIKDDSTRMYSIMRELEKYEDESGDWVQIWECKNEEGEDVTIKLVILKNFNNERQFYLEFPNKKISYHLKK